MPVLINEFSATSTQIEMYFEETKLSVGTAFFWRRDKNVFLVTNWHNVSGKDNLSKKHLDRINKSEPNKITFRIFDDGDLNKPHQININLYNDDQPIWLEHPVYQSMVDVVCIGLGELQGVFCVNDFTSKDPYVPMVSQDIFILGYPHGVGTLGFPIWKRGSIASEPDIDIDGLPLFYVDSASAKGMSGSPVLVRSSDGKKRSGMSVLAGPTSTDLLGVYSGRLITKEPLETQIGRVWKSRVIDEIVWTWDFLSAFGRG
ncbi:trypsin-like peptidase domain-containing protein [Agrobacterium rubi]|uniref:trypsin-like peptidase domain-containing protein n=1 Tax=Agrobacterium rubi TaxID=28099 RepID=UPI001573A8C2|nr:trypsin-like peptidase domain-containing protein [Agrobacterium rubi]NTF07215.1 trypsin-like peptidase domain-containing protein [Agrobacterium rubi]NTF19471.1 trypsin-like peptidase domain-containing protein [Agrobacterium rubi]NTF26434.1 trypsin-like peptidase domain-containing protein [Agrobacterium rubi]